MFNQIKKNFELEISKYATKNIINKLQDQGIEYEHLVDKDFNDLVAKEIEILKIDSKKVGTGIGIGILISVITGI
jgi:hypothetical protein